MNTYDAKSLPTKEELLKKISEVGRIDIYTKDSCKRKELHEFAHKNGLYHVSYTNRRLSYDKSTLYYCEYCTKRVDAETHDCCDDYSCGEFSAYCLECRHVVWDTGIAETRSWELSRDGTSEIRCPRRPIYNNVIAIANDVSLLEDVFETKNIKMKRAEHWIHNREKQRTSVSE
jgi:hypothetical protein